MERPSLWLSAAIIVHGVFGAFVEMIIIMTNRLPTPLGHFYNDSLSAHYGIVLDDASGVIQVNSLIGNICIVGQVLGTLFLLPKMDRFGRKKMTVYLCGGVGVASSALIIMSKSANSIEFFALAQFLAGGLLTIRAGVVKLYLAECAPDGLRGFSSQAVAAMSGFVILANLLLSLEQVFGTDDKWPLIGMITLVMSVVFMFMGSLIPESPKYMSWHNAPKEKVVKAIKQFHGKKVDAEEILTDYSCEFHLTNTGHTSFKQLWGDVTLRESLILVTIGALVHSVSGYQILALNNVPLKIRYGFTNSAALLIDTAIGISATPFLFLLPYSIEKIGRRKLFLTCMGLSITTLFLMFVTQIAFKTIGPGPLTMSLSMIFTILNLASLISGAATMGIVLVTDLLPQSAKAVATQCLFLTISVSAFAVNFFYSSLEPLLGAFILVPFLLIQAFFLYYCYWNLPETKGKPVYQNYQQVRSRANSVGHSLLGGRSRATSKNYGSKI